MFGGASFYAGHARADRYCDIHKLPSLDGVTSITNKAQGMKRDFVDTSRAAVNKLFIKLLKSRSQKIREGYIN